PPPTCLEPDTGFEVRGVHRRRKRLHQGYSASDQRWECTTARALQAFVGDSPISEGPTHRSKQRPRVRQVHAIEPLGERAVSVADHPPAFVSPTVVRENPGEARRCAQFKGSSALLACNVEGTPEPGLSSRQGLGVSQLQLPLEPAQLGLVISLPGP